MVTLAGKLLGGSYYAGSDVLLSSIPKKEYHLLFSIFDTKAFSCNTGTLDTEYFFWQIKVLKLTSESSSITCYN